MARIKKFLHENLKNDKILIQRVAYGVSPVAAIRFFFRRGKMYKINEVSKLTGVTLRVPKL